jgi:hypothetical protein
MGSSGRMVMNDELGQVKNSSHTLRDLDLSLIGDIVCINNVRKIETGFQMQVNGFEIHSSEPYLGRS